MGETGLPAHTLEGKGFLNGCGTVLAGNLKKTTKRAYKKLESGQEAFECQQDDLLFSQYS
jgi:hypothetical protein